MSVFIKEKKFYTGYLRLTLIIAIQNTISFAVNLMDNVMLGTYSETALSGAAISNQVQFLLQMVICGIADGIVVMCSQYWGKKEKEPIRQIAGGALKVGLIVSFLLFFIVYFFPEQCLYIFTDKNIVVAEGIKYIRVVCFSYVLYAVTTLLLASLRSVETVKIGIVISVVTLVTNIIFNYLLIFGKLGFPEMGSAGAALATIIARLLEFGIILVYVFVIDKKLQLKLKHLIKHNHTLFMDFVRVGLPVMLSGFLWALGSWAQTAILGRLDANVIAANSIAITIMQLMSITVYASASASSVIIGKAVGENEIPRVKTYAKTLQIIYLILGLFTCGLMLLFKDVILGLYNISPETKELASQFIMVLSITVIGTAYQMSCLTGIVRGGGDTKFVLFNDLIFVWLVVIPLSYLAAFVFNWPPMIVFICLKCDQILKCFVAVVKVNRFRWIKVLTR